MKPVMRREDIVMAVEAARTAWILTDIDRKRRPMLRILRLIPAAGTFAPRSSRCWATDWQPARSIN